MQNLTSQERLNRICKILIKGIYFYTSKQSWLEDGATSKDHAKALIIRHSSKKAENVCFSSYFEGQK